MPRPKLLRTAPRAWRSPKVGFRMARWILYSNGRSGRRPACLFLPDSTDIFADAVPTMNLEPPEQKPVFGYLSAIHSSEYGCFGGYLIVSSLGRPLEFHCTAPVRPTRAQEILYGPALEAYLVGEQIRGSLLGATKIRPQLILTDQAAALGDGPPAVPLVLAHSIDNTANGKAAEVGVVDEVASNLSLARHNPILRSWSDPWTAYGCELRLPHDYDCDSDMLIRLLNQLAERVELMEPFGRIHEAIREAQRIGQHGPESDVRAA